MAGPTGIEPMAYCLGMNIIYPFGIITLTPNNILNAYSPIYVFIIYTTANQLRLAAVFEKNTNDIFVILVLSKSFSVKVTIPYLFNVLK